MKAEDLPAWNQLENSRARPTPAPSLASYTFPNMRSTKECRCCGPFCNVTVALKGRSRVQRTFTIWRMANFSRVINIAGKTDIDLRLNTLLSVSSNGCTMLIFQDFGNPPFNRDSSTRYITASLAYGLMA